MAAKTPVSRVGVGYPLVREYRIADMELYRNDESVSICKYVKRRKTDKKTPEGKDIYEDYLATEWVFNPEKIDLRGSSIKVTTEIV